MKLELKKWRVASGVLSCFVGLTVAEEKRPNILFAIADDMTHASCYGYEFVSTPHFDSIARDGIMFTRMYTPSSKCSPSRAVILTGRNPWQLEEAGNHNPFWPEKFVSVMESLRTHGYFTGYTGKGWCPGKPPAGRHLTGRCYNKIKNDPPLCKSMFSADYTANFKQFMHDKPADQPFFFWYGAKESHRGYQFKSGVAAGKRFEDIDFMPSFWVNNDQTKHDILDYAVEVEHYDMHLGQILQHLETLGELDNTLVIATSDNGMPFPRYKGHPHEFATRLPFVAKWPGHIVHPGRVSSDFASFVDLAPTFLDVAGIPQTQDGMEPIEGHSLFDIFADTVTGRDEVLTGRERNDMCRPNGWSYPVRSYHKGNYVYMHNFEPDRWPCGTPAASWRDTDGSPTKFSILGDQTTSQYQLCFGKRPQEELYDISKDPECLTNLAANPEFSPLKDKLKTALFSRLEDQGDPRMFGKGDVFDHYDAGRWNDYEGLLKRGAQLRKQYKLEPIHPNDQ